MPEMFDVIVIGGGASGLMCAANIDSGLKIAVIEKTANIGTKLLISGSGQCNVTHAGDIDSFLKAYGKKGSFLKKSLYQFSNTDVQNYFEIRSVPLFERSDGKIFPKSLKSKDIVDVLKKELLSRKHQIASNSPVISVAFNSESFVVKTEKHSFVSSKLVIATGGCSYPQTGSSGDGYKFAKNFGHKIVTPAPALVSLKVVNWPFSSISGNSFVDAVLTSKTGSAKNTGIGELLITHKGISGPLVLDFSRYLQQKDTVIINFAGEFNTESMVEEITGLFALKPSSKIENILFKTGLPQNFTLLIIELARIDKNTLCGSVSKKQIRKLSELITRYEAEIIKDSFNEAMATSGGVELSEVDISTMESKILKGLFFCGEVLDIDGDTGGYNIQAAFSTAVSVADSLNKTFALRK